MTNFSQNVVFWYIDPYHQQWNICVQLVVRLAGDWSGPNAKKYMRALFFNKHLIQTFVTVAGWSTIWDEVEQAKLTSNSNSLWRPHSPDGVWSPACHVKTPVCKINFTCLIEKGEENTIDSMIGEIITNGLKSSRNRCLIPLLNPAYAPEAFITKNLFQSPEHTTLLGRLQNSQQGVSTSSLL